MTVSELERFYRNLFEDTDSQKYFLTLPIFLDYLNEAEEEAAYRKNLLFDKTSSFCTIAVTAGTSVYALEDCIYAINYASLTDGSGVVTRITPTDQIEMDRISSTWRSDTQQPQSFIHRDNSIELTSIPDAAYTLNLEVYRLPLDKMTSEGSEPEIHRNHHRYLVNWVLYRAYSNPDVDMRNDTKAAVYLGQFVNYFGNRPIADNQRGKYANRPHRNKAYF